MSKRNTPKIGKGDVTTFVRDGRTGVVLKGRALQEYKRRARKAKVSVETLFNHVIAKGLRDEDAAEARAVLIKRMTKESAQKGGMPGILLPKSKADFQALLHMPQDPRYAKRHPCSKPLTR